MEIRKNIIKADIDYQELDKQFDFFLIETDKKKYPSARLLDVPFAEGKILAVEYTYGNSLIVMLKKSDNNKSVIKSIIEKYNDENDKCLIFKQLSLPIEQKFEHSLVQILFNSLAKRHKDNFSNLGGRFYYFCKKLSNQVVCIELKLSKNCVFSLNVVTFTKAEKETKGKKYVLQANNTFRPKTELDSGETYTIFQFKNQKNVVPFLDTTILIKKLGISSSLIKYFDQSKIGIFRKILNRFNNEYGNIVKISFVQESDWKSIAPDSAAITKKQHLERLKRAYEGKTICIVDTVGNDRSIELSSNLKNTLNRFFEAKTAIKVGKRIVNKNLTIRIIHDKAYFEVNKDEKDNYAVYSDCPVQNVTIEDFPLKESESLTANCIVLLNELLVKNDLINTKTISLTNWNYQKDWIFCFTDANESDEFSEFFMRKIKNSGIFIVERMTKNLFNQTEYEKLRAVFLSGKKFRGIVMNENEEINIIQETNLFMMPNFEAIYSYFAEGKTSLRTKELREQCYLGCVDIHYKEEQNIGYYSSGVIGNGMDAKIEKATCVRSILPFDNSPLFFSEVIDTMNVTFVRNGQLTVLPFPFKYLREYAKMFGKKN